jgi:hypothetical protein
VKTPISEQPERHFVKRIAIWRARKACTRSLTAAASHSIMRCPQVPGTIRVKLTAEDGIVKNRGNIWIWYTDDARHLPVQIRARLFWGTITFHLKSIEAM